MTAEEKIIKQSNTGTKKQQYKMNHMISKMYRKLGKKRSTSRAQTVMEVETQTIDD